MFNVGMPNAQSMNIEHRAFDILDSTSNELVIPELEHPRSGQLLDPIRHIEAQVFPLKVPRADTPLRIDHPLAHPLLRRARMRAGVRLQERQPLEVAALLLARRALAAPGIDRLRDLVLLANRARGARPAVMKHARPG